MIDDGTNVLKRVRNKQFNKFNKNNNLSSNESLEKEKERYMYVERKKEIERWGESSERER